MFEQKRLGIVHWVAIVPITIALIFVLTFLITSLQSRIARRNANPAGKRPPILPHWLPWLGSAHLVTTDGWQMCKKLLQTYGHEVPAGIRIGPVKLYIPSDPEQVHRLLHVPPGVEANPVVFPLAMHRILGMPFSAISLMEEDDSGPYSKPKPGTNVPANGRFRNATWEPTHRFLNGESSFDMSEQYSRILHRNILTDARIGTDWVELPDLFDFIRSSVTSAGIESVCGEAILDLNPTLVEDYTGFEESARHLLYGWPKWLAPALYRKRDKLLDSIRKWHEYLDAHMNAEKSEDVLSPVWKKETGSRFIRAKRRAHLALDPKRMDAVAQAASDVGVIFALTTNSTKAIFWLFFEIFSRPALVARVREAMKPFDPHDTRGLSQIPLLRSIFNEVLRLHAVGLVPRRLTAPSRDFAFGGWSIPGTSVLALSSWHGAMNEQIWNQGTADDAHPVQSFWADRFVIYPGDVDSGPVRKEARPQIQAYSCADEAAVRDGVFSTEGLHGAFLPFGGGPGTCPGRSFALREAVSTLGLFAARYEIELQTPAGWQPRMHGGWFPLGVLPPRDRVPFRIKLRSA